MLHKFPKKEIHPDKNPRYQSGSSLVKTEKEELRDRLCDILQVDQLEAIIENNLAKASNWTIKRLIQHIENRIMNERHAALTNGITKNKILGR
jgi:chaperonin cofactor prefoldin